jgi:biotin transport system substrate-specific component
MGKDRTEIYMAKTAEVSLGNIESGPWSLATQMAMVVSASLFVAVCARVSVPLPFTPVPLSLSNFGVLLVGLTLGSRRGFAALVLYLMEGASGLPVFSHPGLGGVAQLLGPSGGYLWAYPLVAFTAGWILERTDQERSDKERTDKTFARAAFAGVAAEILLFASGLTWLAVLTHSVAKAFMFGLYWFFFAEIIKVLFAAALSTRFGRGFRAR